MTETYKIRLKPGCGVHNEPTPAYLAKKPNERKPRDLGAYTLVKAGEVFESVRPLHLEFENKFELVKEGDTPVQVITEARRRAVAGGIAAGLWPEDDRHFLENLNEDGFQRVFRQAQMRSGVTPAAVTPGGFPQSPVPPETGTNEFPPTPPTDKKTDSILGSDVTDTFGQAYDNGLKVYKNAKDQYNVARGPDFSKPLNKKPLDRTKVEEFVHDWLEDQQRK
jgi:hypothetical protein